MNKHWWLMIVWTAILAGCLCPCSMSLAAITSVRIVPTQPTALDTITFTVEGMFPDGCWRAQSFNFVQQTPTQFRANVNAVDIWRPDMFCPLFIVEYAYSAALGQLAPGTYTVFVTEYHESLRDSLPDVAELTFDVTDSLLPVRGLTANRSESSIVLRWTAVEGATGYRIYRAAEFEFEIGPSHLLDSSVIPGYTDANVMALPDEKFFYCVTATR